jgi:outer membrane lipoprotein-sorting protein
MEVFMGARALAGSLSLFVLLSSPLAFGQQDPEALLRNMKPSWKKVTDFSGEMLKRELFGKKLSAEEKMVIKFAKPFKVYTKFLTGPNKNREALYQGKDWNGGEIKATSGSAVNLTVNLAPFGNTALKGQHHPITHVGFDNAIKNTLYQLDTAKKNGELAIKISGTDTVADRSCTKVELTFNTKAGQTITPKKGDTWLSLAQQYSSDYYVLQHNNPKAKPGDPSASIWVPTYYGSKMELCIDDATGLPTRTKTWDHAGNLYEEYTYTKFKVNAGLTDLDFDPENAAYDF